MPLRKLSSINNHLKKENLITWFVPVTFLHIILLFFGPFRWDNVQFLVFSLFVFSFVIYKVAFMKESKIQFISLDLSWFLFIIIGFFTFFWSVDPSLIWYYLFGWIVYFLLVIVYRNLTESVKLQILKSLHFFFFLLILYCFYFILLYLLPFEVIIDFDAFPFSKLKETFSLRSERIILNKQPIWNNVFGHNSNYVCTYLVCLYPYLFTDFYNKRIWWLRLVATITIFVLICIASSRGALVCFLLILLCYAKFKKKQIYTVVFSSFLFLLLLYLYSGNTILDSIFMPEFKEYGNSLRLDLSKISYSIFFEHPFSGIGLGNWSLYALSENIDNIPGLSRNYTIFQTSDHNYYSLLLSEVGLFGVFFFVLPFFIIIKAVCFNFRIINSYEKAAFLSLTVFLLTSFIYKTTPFSTQFFSKTQYIAFLSIGIITSNKALFKRIENLKFSILVSIFSCISVVWFFYYRNGQIQYQTIQRLSENEPAKAALQLEKIYNPKIFSRFEPYQPISYILAKLNWQVNNFEKADFYFEKALETDYNNLELLLNYSRYLIKSKRNLGKAYEVLNKIEQIQPSLLELKVLYSELLIADKKYQNARKKLNEIPKNQYVYPYRILLLEQKLYTSEYIFSLTNIPQEQKDELVVFFESFDYQKDLLDLERYETNKEKNKVTNIKKKIIQDFYKVERKYFELLSDQSIKIYLKDRFYAEVKEKAQLLFDKSSISKVPEIHSLLLNLKVDIQYLKWKGKLNKDKKEELLRETNLKLAKLLNYDSLGIENLKRNLTKELNIN